jgi:hypothetical protein
LLKDEIIKLKDEGQVLLRMSELKQQLDLRLIRVDHENSGNAALFERLRTGLLGKSRSCQFQSFAFEELRAVVGLLAGPGIVWQLEFGDFILLQPQRINSYAAALIRSVRGHSEEIGCIAEEILLAGKLDYQDIQRLPEMEEQIVLRAMHQTFVNHGLCLREHTDRGTLLIFPSYFKRQRPDLEGHPLVLVTYRFEGPLDEIYATLVVKLHYTPAFEKDRLWRFAADFKTPSGKRLGFKMTNKVEGAAELQIYFEPGIEVDTQVTFIRYVHDHLMSKARNVVRVRQYVCPKCNTAVEGQRAIDMRVAMGFEDVFCGACGHRIPLRDVIEAKFTSEEAARHARELDTMSKAAINKESLELILVGHACAIAGETGQIYRQYPSPDHGIDGEIEFKDSDGNPSGQCVYLQFKHHDSYILRQLENGSQSFRISTEDRFEYWCKKNSPVMLVIRTSDGSVRWMDVINCLAQKSQPAQEAREFTFFGEPFNALSLRRIREKMLQPA